MRNRFKGISFFLYLWLILLPCTEIALRVVGYRPYQRSDYSIRSEPALCLLPDARLGFALAPGAFSVTINEGHRYRVRHGADSLRITGETAQSGQPEIFVLGCSYTYGMGVDDTAHYPYLLQNELPGYRVRNFAVPGYGTTQSYLQLEQRISQGNLPALVVLGYAGFHDERNVLTPTYRKHLHIGFEEADPTLRQHMAGAQFPFVRLEDSSASVQAVAWETMYRGWPGRKHFALVNALQNLAEARTAARLQPEKSTFILIRDMYRFCQSRDIPFVVAGLTPGLASKKMLQDLRDAGIQAVDISVDLDNPDFTHAPHDTHPNHRAHAHYAKTLLNFLLQRGLILPSSVA